MTGIFRNALAGAVIAGFATFNFASPVLAQQSPSAAPSPAPPSSGSGGGGSGGGGMAIEGTILAYQALQSDANGIATAVSSRLPVGTSKVVIATPADVVAFLQLRIVLSQIGLLNDRMNEMRETLYHLACAPTVKRPKISKSGGGPFTPVLSSLFSSPSDISTMVSTVASLTSTTESVAGQSANFTDPTLVTLVAETLNRAANTQKTIFVYVPGVAPPNWAVFPPPATAKTSILQSDQTESFLYQGIQSLEGNRSNLQTEAISALNNPKKPHCKTDKNLAMMIKQIDAAATAADKLVSGLIGSAPPPPSSLLGQPAQSTASAKPPNGNAKPPASSASQINQTVNVNPAASPKSSSGPPPLQKLLYIDLLLHQLSAGEPADGVPTDVFLVSVQALEAGGSQLTKTQTFLGTRLYYSGGAAASFALIDSGGSMVCSGVAYGYRGFIKADDMALAVGPGNPAVVPGTQNTLPNGQSNTPGC